MPTPAEFRHIFDSLYDQPDLSIAMVGTALVESLVEKLIAANLPAITPELEGRLFKNRGPLSDLESKILLAIALKIFHPAVGGVLNTVRSIRNTFAHSKSPVYFDTPEISARIFSDIKPFIVRMMEEVGVELDCEKANEKIIFLTCIKILLYTFDHICGAIAGNRFFFEPLQEK